VTTPSASERFVVDSSGWIEYLSAGKKAAQFATYLEGSADIFLPSIVAYEVLKKLLREGSREIAERFFSLALGCRERALPLDAPLALHAARVRLDTRLAMAEAIIYATAQLKAAQVVTTDPHVSGLPGASVL